MSRAIWTAGCNGIVARTFSQSTVEELAHWSSVPVINALSDLYHPCQALADVLTLREHFGELRGLKLAFVGDGNNVAHSLMLTAVRLGMDFALATPAGLRAESGDRGAGRGSGRSFRRARSRSRTIPQQAVAGAHAVYTDVWTSMGQEQEADQAAQAFCRPTR